jgi:hypothetical protein
MPMAKVRKITNKQIIKPWARTFALAVTTPAHSEWFEEAVFSHVVVGEDGARVLLRNSKAAFPVPIFPSALFPIKQTYRFHPSSEFTADCKLVADWLTMLPETDGAFSEYLNPSCSFMLTDAIERARKEEFQAALPRGSASTPGATRLADGHLHSQSFVELLDGTKKWYSGGNLHREDGPAVERPNGDKEWYRHGYLHRLDGPAVESRSGTKEWYRDGQLHREDGPALEFANGGRAWCLNSRLHREGGPAIEWANGTKEWYRDGRHHREDGPAIIYASGIKRWMRHGKCHREDGPAAEYPNGDREWYLNGLLHRESGPAVEWPNGYQEWHSHGRPHREDGPAVVWPGGYEEWFLQGEEVTRDDVLGRAPSL